MRTSIASLRFACYFDLYNISMYVYYVEVVFNFVATVPSQSCAFTVLIFMAVGHPGLELHIYAYASSYVIPGEPPGMT